LPGWAAIPLEELPRASADEDAPAWYPLQHVFGLTAFGANAFASASPGDVLVDEHDESGSGQEELYVVVAGRATFVLDGTTVEAPAITVIAVRDPSVHRSATAGEPGTTLLALGGRPRADFESTWREEHFEGVRRLL
jgi:uncharacterized cupin superfamily protein